MRATPFVRIDTNRCFVRPNSNNPCLLTSCDERDLCLVMGTRTVMALAGLKYHVIVENGCRPENTKRERRLRVNTTLECCLRDEAFNGIKACELPGNRNVLPCTRCAKCEEDGLAVAGVGHDLGVIFHGGQNYDALIDGDFALKALEWPDANEIW